MVSPGTSSASTPSARSTAAAHAPALFKGRRRTAVALLCAGALAAALAMVALGHADERRYRVAFANLTDEPAVTLEGTGFTGHEIRESFLLAPRAYPFELVFYANGRDCGRAAANVEDAIARKVDLFIQYCHEPQANAILGDKLKAAGIPVLAVNEPLPGAPLYTLDNAAAGRLAGDALGDFAVRSWRGQPVEGVLIGPLTARGGPERAPRVQERLPRHVPRVRRTSLDTQGNVPQA